MADLTKRLRYFNGQLLDESDFNLEQSYCLDRDRRHQRLLHSPGIADGLTVDAGIGAVEAKVAPGTAMDGLGQQIVLAESRTLSLGAPLAGKTVLLVISYAENPADKSSVGAQDFTRWQESPLVEVAAAGAPPEETHVRLASLQLDAAGKVKQIDLSVRRNAGARLGANDLQVGGSLTVQGTLTIATSGKGVQLAGSDGRLGIGTAQPKATLEVNSGSGTVSPIVAVSTPNGDDFFSIFGARQDSQNNDLLWHRGPLRLGTAATFGGQAFSEKMRITEDGNVGIGLNKPTEKLVVGGNVRLEGKAEIAFADNGSIKSFDGNHAILFRRSENKLEIREFGDLLFSPGATSGTTTPQVVMLANGRVGIGTSAPAAALDVAGDLRVAGGLTLTGEVTQEGWRPVTFQNGWTNFGSGFNPARFMIDSLGFTHLEGLVKDGKVGDAFPVFTLPPGLTPENRQLFCVQTAPNAAARVDVLPTGLVVVVAGDPRWVSLDGLTFRAARFVIKGPGGGGVFTPPGPALT